MSARNYCAVILASCVAFSAVDALAQTPSTSTAPGATGATAPADSTTAPATSTDATDQRQSAQAAAPAKKTAHHAKKHNAMHATQRSQTPVSSNESPYRTALRQCVEGQASQRHRCLDHAIAQYGRS